MYYWCAVCHVENVFPPGCGWCGVPNKMWSYSHQDKQRALQSTTSESQYRVSAPSVEQMSDQEVKVCYVSGLVKVQQLTNSVFFLIFALCFIVEFYVLRAQWGTCALFFLVLQTRRAKVKMTATLVEHNVPLAFADHLGPALRECFKESKTAREYRCAWTKALCIVNKALATYFTEELMETPDSFMLSLQE